MRVRDAGQRTAGAERRAEARRFAESLREARERAVGEAPPRGAPPAVTRRAGAGPKGVVAAERREASRGEQRAAAIAPRDAADPSAATAELRALARAIPPWIQASALAAGAPLALAFGRSLEVELREAPGGVELLLRADRTLARACAVGLPELLAALRRRGIAVTRAEVRPRGGAGPPPR